MPLQADPTVIYPVTKGKPLGRRILKSELNADNPYNTYKRRGLPDGPIANPGKASIEAVLHPARTKALYFVADGSGGHAFTETYDAHQKNVARLRAMEKQIQNDTVEPADDAQVPAAAPPAADTPTATTPPKPAQQKKPARPARQGAVHLSPPVVQR